MLGTTYIPQDLNLLTLLGRSICAVQVIKRQQVLWTEILHCNLIYLYPLTDNMSLLT